MEMFFDFMVKFLGMIEAMFIFFFPPISDVASVVVSLCSCCTSSFCSSGLSVIRPQAWEGAAIPPYGGFAIARSLLVLLHRPADELHGSGISLRLFLAGDLLVYAINSLLPICCLAGRPEDEQACRSEVARK